MQRWQFMYFWLLNWIIYWIESLEFILNWIIVWIEFSETNIESNIELNQLSAKFKHWIESDRVSIRATICDNFSYFQIILKIFCFKKLQLLNNFRLLWQCWQFWKNIYFYNYWHPFDMFYNFVQVLQLFTICHIFSFEN